MIERAEPSIPKQLNRHHIPAMRPEHSSMLLGRLDGLAGPQLARALSVSEPTVKLWLSIVSAEIAMCLPQEQRLTGEMRGAWIYAHHACCLVVSDRVDAR